MLPPLPPWSIGSGLLEREEMWIGITQGKGGYWDQYSRGVGGERTRSPPSLPMRGAWSIANLGIHWSQFLGPWYVVALASNSTWFRDKRTGMFMCKSVLAPSTDGGSLNLTSIFLR